MKAVVQTGTEEIEVQEREQPVPEADEVLVRVEHVGLCGSDVHAYLQMDGFDFIQIPRIIGHEYAGRVVETGPNVTRFENGDIVVEAPIHPCGECHQCEIGEENVCQHTTITGMDTNGAYAEFITVSQDHLVGIPSHIPTEHAALTEPLSIAARTVYDRSVVTPGDNVLVQGPGPIGVLTAALLHSLGASVLVSGLKRDAAHRLPLVESLGIDTVDITAESLDEHITERSNGVGVDAVFDTTGHHSGVESAVNVVRKGGEVIVVGLPGEASELFFTPIVRGELDVRAAYGATKANFKQAVRTLDSTNFDADAVIDTTYRLDEAEEAIADFRVGKTVKPVFSV